MPVSRILSLSFIGQELWSEMAWKGLGTEV